MPALITHRLFGEDAARRLPDGIVGAGEELLAFLLANQGPDPFFARFSTRPSVARACHRLAREMHGGHVVEALVAARGAAGRLPEEDKEVGRAFVLGLLAHYVLDSRAHPFVYAQQRALVEANPQLAGAEGAVHAVIESDLDVWMLAGQRGQSVEDAPAAAMLDHTDRIANVGGAIFSQLAGQVFSMSVAAGEYGGALGDYRLIYALIDPAEGRLSRVIARLERLVRPHSQAAALAHHVTAGDECPAANLSCRAWEDPATGETSELSFGDLYFEALDAWPAFAEALVRGDTATLRGLTRSRDYDGNPSPRDEG